MAVSSPFLYRNICQLSTISASYLPSYLPVNDMITVSQEIKVLCNYVDFVEPVYWSPFLIGKEVSTLRADP